MGKNISQKLLITTFLIILLMMISDCVVFSGEWIQQNPLPRAASFYSIWGSSATDVFAVGREGTIIHYDGSTWSEMDNGTTNNLSGVWGTSGSDVFAVGLAVLSFTTMA